MTKKNNKLKHQEKQRKTFQMVYKKVQVTH